MPKHGKQHFVAQSYLRAWCDPETPADQDAYVWRFAKDGTNGRRKAPENIFHETDLYTIIAPDGGRDLRLEHGLAQLEDEFVKIRDRKLVVHEELDQRDRLLLCAFVAAAQMRTPAQRDHLSGMWGQALEQGKAVEEWARIAATPAQRRAVGGLPAPDPDRSFSLEEVQALAERPLQMTLAAHVRTLTPMLARLDLFVLMTDDSAGFITSDNPCVWFDAEACRRPPLRQGVGLAYPSIEITLPVSPRQLLLFHRRGRSGYVSPPRHVVDELNRRTVAHCADYFVTHTNATRPIWFDPGKEPEDSWRKLHLEPKSRSEAP
jgi:uncharacterized protein DUF4238